MLRKIVFVLSILTTAHFFPSQTVVKYKDIKSLTNGDQYSSKTIDQPLVLLVEENDSKSGSVVVQFVYSGYDDKQNFIRKGTDTEKYTIDNSKENSTANLDSKIKDVKLEHEDLVKNKHSESLKHETVHLDSKSKDAKSEYEDLVKKKHSESLKHETVHLDSKSKDVKSEHEDLVKNKHSESIKHETVHLDSKSKDVKSEHEDLVKNNDSESLKHETSTKIVEKSKIPEAEREILNNEDRQWLFKTQEAYPITNWKRLYYDISNPIPPFPEITEKDLRKGELKKNYAKDVSILSDTKINQTPNRAGPQLYPRTIFNTEFDVPFF